MSQDIEWSLVLDLLIVPQVWSSFGILQGKMTKHELVFKRFFLILTRLDDFRLPLLSDLIYSTKSDQENLANRTS